ncbi:hypothetical protein GCM10025865_21630 [Paraoerskovia sediminicola]|uniref:Glycosyl transferase family 1 domain-containing protein n=1 Tax=Paraoerskovia sediminicola TaxID=1138587 RepID=A0ABN6XDJ9_9CELL|nr:glycosyltransferase [Paraoerskovia sediminicola]BDZ42864.1 hypothetical protein GCM10025865_21630 [Paraoerskovia sediminicola]
MGTSWAERLFHEPDVVQYASATWTLPIDHGGMTGVLLQRSRLIAHAEGVEVPILTFDPNLDVAEAESVYRERGTLDEAVSVRNLWHDLAERPDTALPRSGAVVRAESARYAEVDGTTTIVPEGHRRDRVEHRRADDELVMTERRRSDGSVFVRVYRAVESGMPRVVALLDRAGRPVHVWRGIWDLYRWWLDETLQAPAHVVVDSKSMVSFFATYRRSGITVTHLVHGTHLVAEAEDPFAPVNPKRGRLLDRLEDFDAVAFLTNAQREDVVARVGEKGNLVVIPNAFRPAPRGEKGQRAVDHGMVLGGLNARKRTSHAVLAVGEAAERLGRRLTLDVVGDGARRPHVEEAARSVAGSADVVLHGFVPDGAQRFGNVSFSMLTSTSEGQPLVLLESMAAGCVPIAYDVRYGPSDIITHGVDGYLVPAGDMDLLAGAIVEFCSLPPERRDEMSRAARRRAKDFSESRAAKRWREHFDQLIPRDPPGLLTRFGLHRRRSSKD